MCHDDLPPHVPSPPESSRVEQRLTPTLVDARCAGRPLDSIREQLAAEDTENQRKLARLNGCGHPLLATAPPHARTLKTTSADAPQST